MEDSSLDEFFDEGAEDGTDESDATESATADEESIEAAVVTSKWNGSKSACDGCGEHVSRRWNDGGQFVCADCKSW